MNRHASNRPGKTPRVSIIMLTYNRPQYIGRALESVLAQDFEDWETIVIHDGANEEIAAVMQKWEKRDDRILYFRRLRGGNIANATNFAIQQAQGEYIAVLDDDDYWPSITKLSKQVQFLDENPDYAACGGGMITIDQRGIEKTRFYKALADEDIRRLALVANPMAHSTGMYRRALVTACGGYDETLAGFQDWDIWLKLGQRGKLCNFPEYWQVYQMWPGSGSASQMKANARSAVRIVMRHRERYPRFAAGLVMALGYYAYALLPKPLRKISFESLSRFKKNIFAAPARHVERCMLNSNEPSGARASGTRNPL